MAVIVAPTIGPTLGGWITDNYSWHWIFFINVPIGIVSLLLVHWLVDEPEVLEQERNQASSLVNVARNLGGSIGVSLANTELMQRAQFHQSRLVEAAVPSSLSYQNTLERVTEFFISQGSPLVKAQGQAVGWIGHTIVSQATLLSYIDVFWSFSIFALIMVPLALTLKHVELSRASGPE